ncbi:MAG TPA: hypothetical protein P5516_03585 [Anaerolineaceae bacterium]|nr:hypothetical protein [Anaerolineaceae bacterium]HRT91552.1 hypothetical protein [Anaerolineaceae bacterium]
MADIRCLICNRMNDASSPRCWYCRSPLPGYKEPPAPDEPGEGEIPEPEPLAEISGRVEPTEESGESWEGEAPEWLARIRMLKEQDEQKTRETSGLDTEDSGLPEWIINLRAAEPPVMAEKTAEEALLEDSDAKATTPADTYADSRFEETGGRASGEFTGEPVEGETTSPAANKPFETAELRDGQPAHPIFEDDLPEWLSADAGMVETHSSQKDQTARPFISKEENKLADGVLPAWLKAIRPLDAVSPATPDALYSPGEEGEGILAGISGTLRSQRLEDREVKMPSRPHELVVTPMQQKNAELLYRLSNPDIEETSPVAITKKSRPQRKTLKIFAAVILFLAVLLPYGFRSLPVIIPVLFPKEVVDTLGVIEGIPAGKPVLIAAQFEGGLAGELTLSSEPVFQHLVSHGVPLALMSTNASGYAILEEQLRRASAGVSGYLFSERVVNLGYLPGGTIGLISLVGDIRAALPYSTALEPAWETTPIAGARTLADFAAILLLTDNPEIVRAWVEQTGRIEKPPILLGVVSAQAAPLAQPYYDSGQVQGLVAGSSGALAYQMIRQVPGKASTTFASYQFALFIAALLIFLGGVVSLVTTTGAAAHKKGRG